MDNQKEIYGMIDKMINVLPFFLESKEYYNMIEDGLKWLGIDYHEVLNDDEINAILILTPHSLHANMVC